MVLFTDQFRHVLSASDLSLDLFMLRARVYTENYIGVRVYENYGTIVGGLYVYRLMIVQRSFNDCSTIVKLRQNGNFLMTDTVVTHVQKKKLCTCKLLFEKGIFLTATTLLCLPFQMRLCWRSIAALHSTLT